MNVCWNMEQRRKKMICNKCNHSLPDDSEFCQYCGNKIILGDSSEINSVSNEEFKPITSVAAEVKVPKQATPVKQQKKTKKSLLDIINIFVLILPFIFSLIGAENYYEEEIFAMIFCIGFLPLVLKILNVVKLKNNIIVTIIIAGSLFVMMCCSFGCDIEMGLPICLTTLYLLICEMCKIVKSSIDKYHGTHNYRMKCYKKINLLNEYREKGIITETEFEESRKQIISKIHN